MVNHDQPPRIVANTSQVGPYQRSHQARTREMDERGETVEQTSCVIEFSGS